MGWETERKPPPLMAHRCPKPDVSTLEPADRGRIWRCDECGQRWQVYRDDTVNVGALRWGTV